MNNGRVAVDKQSNQTGIFIGELDCGHFIVGIKSSHPVPRLNVEQSTPSMFPYNIIFMCVI